MENGEHGDGIGGRHDGPKVEDVEEPEGDGDELGEAVHDRRDDEGGDDSPHESEGKDGPDVGEKLAQERKEGAVRRRRRFFHILSAPYPEGLHTHWLVHHRVRQNSDSKVV